MGCPLTYSEWADLLTSAGLEVEFNANAPMHLLEPKRVINDEGFFGALRFIFNVATHANARSRVLAMKKIFRKYKNHLAAIVLVARKPE